MTVTTTDAATDADAARAGRSRTRTAPASGDEYGAEARWRWLRAGVAALALVAAAPALAASGAATVPYLPKPRPDAVAPAAAAPVPQKPAEQAASAPAAASAPVPGGATSAKGDLASPHPPGPFDAFQVVAMQATPPRALRAALRNAGLEPVSPGTGELMGEALDGSGADPARPLAMLPGNAMPPVGEMPAPGFTEMGPTGRRAPRTATPPVAEAPPATAPADEVPVAMLPASRPALAEADALAEDDAAPDAPLPQPRPAVAEAVIARAEPDVSDAPDAEVPALRPRRAAEAAIITAESPPPATVAPRRRMASLPGAEMRSAPGGNLPGASLTAPPGAPMGKAAGGLPAACAQLVRSGLAQIEPSTRHQAGGACRVPDLVELSALRLADGRLIDLKPAAAVNCRMAVAVVNWMRADIAPAVARLGSPLETLHVAASYSCRPMNRQRGNRLSEHGRGNALDVGGYTLANGQHYAIRGRQLPASFRVSMRESACARFETVLGPGSDGFHEEHIHVDLANRPRAWAACRWKIPDAPVASRSSPASGG